LEASKRGVSDILGVLPGGRFLAIEVKAPNGKLTDHQKQFLEEVLSNGGFGLIARSPEEVKAEFANIGIRAAQGELFIKEAGS
jgi:hypothetical protein